MSLTIKINDPYLVTTIQSLLDNPKLRFRDAEEVLVAWITANTMRSTDLELPKDFEHIREQLERAQAHENGFPSNGGSPTDVRRYHHALDAVRSHQRRERER